MSTCIFSFSVTCYNVLITFCISLNPIHPLQRLTFGALLPKPPRALPGILVSPSWPIDLLRMQKRINLFIRLWLTVPSTVPNRSLMIHPSLNTCTKNPSYVFSGSKLAPSCRTYRRSGSLLFLHRAPRSHDQ